MPHPLNCWCCGVDAHRGAPALARTGTVGCEPTDTGQLPTMLVHRARPPSASVAAARSLAESDGSPRTRMQETQETGLESPLRRLGFRQPKRHIVALSYRPP